MLSVPCSVELLFADSFTEPPLLPTSLVVVGVLRTPDGRTGRTGGVGIGLCGFVRAKFATKTTIKNPTANTIPLVTKTKPNKSCIPFSLEINVPLQSRPLQTSVF
jgi:hypothetical protein